MNFIRSLDCLSPPFKLKVAGVEGYKNLCGALLTILCFAAAIGLAIAHIIHLNSDQFEWTSRIENTADSLGELNLKDAGALPILFLNNKTSNQYIDDDQAKYHTALLVFNEQKIETSLGTSTVTEKASSIAFKKCSSLKNTNKAYFKDYTNYDSVEATIDKYGFCVDLTKDAILKGEPGDTEITSISLVVGPCTLQTDSECVDKTDFSSKYDLTVVYPTDQLPEMTVDNDVQTNFLVKKAKTYPLTLSQSIPVSSMTLSTEEFIKKSGWPFSKEVKDTLHKKHLSAASSLDLGSVKTTDCTSQKLLYPNLECTPFLVQSFAQSYESIKTTTKTPGLLIHLALYGGNLFLLVGLFSFINWVSLLIVKKSYVSSHIFECFSKKQMNLARKRKNDRLKGNGVHALSESEKQAQKNEDNHVAKLRAEATNYVNSSLDLVEIFKSLSEANLLSAQNLKTHQQKLTPLAGLAMHAEKKNSKLVLNSSQNKKAVMTRGDNYKDGQPGLFDPEADQRQALNDSRKTLNFLAAQPVQAPAMDDLLVDYVDTLNLFYLEDETKNRAAGNNNN